MFPNLPLTAARRCVAEFRRTPYRQQQQTLGRAERLRGRHARHAAVLCSVAYPTFRKALSAGR